MKWEQEIIARHVGAQVTEEDWQHDWEGRDRLIRLWREEIAVLMAERGADLAEFNRWLLLDPGSEESQGSTVPAVVVSYLQSRPVEADPQLVTIDQVAELLACSTDSVQRLVSDGQLEVVRVGRRAIRFDIAAIRNFIRSGGAA